MLKRIALSSCVALLTVAGGPTLAADLDEIVLAPELPRTQPVEIGSGWYLRGDLGYSLKTTGAATGYNVFSAGPPPTYTASAFDTGELDSDWSGSVGFGYSFTDYFRSDVTFDFSEGQFDGTTSSAAPCPGQAAGTTCASNDQQAFTNYGFMANAYFDLGTFVGVTPYLGAGAGATKVVWNTLYDQSRCIPGGGACAPVVQPTVTHPGMESWRFTYALMAGISYDLSRNVKLDLGYRFQNIASGPMFGYDAASVTAGATGVQASDNGFEKHEVRVGLRYTLW